MTNFFMENITSRRTSELFYMPAKHQIIIMLGKLVMLHLNKSDLHSLFTPANKINDAEHLPVYVDKEFKKNAQGEFPDFTQASLLQVAALTKETQTLAQVPEKFQMQALAFTPNEEQITYFFNNKTQKNTLLIDPIILRNTTNEQLKRSIAEAMSDAMLQTNLFNHKRFNTLVIRFIFGCAFGMAYNHLAASFFFDIAKDNQESDNVVFLTAFIFASLTLVGNGMALFNYHGKINQHVDTFFNIPEEMPVERAALEIPNFGLNIPIVHDTIGRLMQL